MFVTYGDVGPVTLAVVVVEPPGTAPVEDGEPPDGTVTDPEPSTVTGDVPGSGTVEPGALPGTDPEIVDPGAVPATLVVSGGHAVSRQSASDELHPTANKATTDTPTIAMVNERNLREMLIYTLLSSGNHGPVLAESATAAHSAATLDPELVGLAPFAYPHPPAADSADTLSGDDAMHTFRDKLQDDTYRQTLLTLGVRAAVYSFLAMGVDIVLYNLNPSSEHFYDLAALIIGVGLPVRVTYGRWLVPDRLVWATTFATAWAVFTILVALAAWRGLNV